MGSKPVGSTPPWPHWSAQSLMAFCGILEENTKSSADDRTWLMAFQREVKTTRAVRASDS